MNITINDNVAAIEKNAVVYARYSSHSQGEQSIDGQLAAAKIYAEAKGYTIIHEYIDRAMTGRNDNRDEFQQMLSDCAKKQFQIIIVWKVDRFGRNREEITFNKYRAKKHGIRVEYVAENLPDSPEGVILESVLEGMAEYYSLQLAQNIRRGYRENAKKCKFAGGRIPLGYKLDAEKHFVIDPATAPAVKTIFQMYAEGYTTTEITDYLNGLGLRTGSGSPFNKNSLRTLLRNEKYVGVFDFKHGEIRVENGVPAIVDRDTFDQVQRMLVVNRKAAGRRWTMMDYLLTDKLFCGTCGAQMVGDCGTSATGITYNYYACVAHKRQKSCSRKPVRQDWIEPLILNHVDSILQNDVLIERIADQVWRYYTDNNKDLEKAELIKHQIVDVDKSTGNVMKAIEMGIINETIQSRMDELTAQKKALEAALAECQLATQALTKEHILFYLRQFRDLDFEDREQQKRMISIFVNSIFVYDDHLDLNLNYGGDIVTIGLQDSIELGRNGGAGGSCSDAKLSAPLECARPNFRIFRNVFQMRIEIPEA